MFESDFDDSRVSLILAIYCMNYLYLEVYCLFFMQNVFLFIPYFSRVCDVL